MLIVLVFARVASFFRDTGGPTTYVARAFGPLAGFQVGWLLTLSRAAAFAANAHLMVTYAGWFWEPLTDGAWHMAAVLLVCVGLTAINAAGLKQGLLAVFTFTLLKLVPLFGLVLLGLSQASPEIFAGAHVPPLDSLGETALVMFYAFVGFETAVVPAGEARRPRRDIPRALVKTIFGITLFYFLIQVVTVSVAPGIDSSKTPLADIALILMGGFGAAALTLGAVFSISGNLTSSMLSAPRMVYAMAHLGSLPRWLGAVSERSQTPANAIVAYGALATLLALSGGFVWLAAMSTVVRLLVYMSVVATVPRLQKLMPPGQAQFRLPGGMTIPLLAFMLSAWLLTHASLKSWLFTGAFMLAGFVFYAMVRRHQRV
jgi:amino acid transporter